MKQLKTLLNKLFGNSQKMEAIKLSIPLLTPRESQVVNLAIQGLATKEIASKLGISSHTVNNHLKKIYEKLGVHSKAELSFKYRENEGLRK